MRELIDKQEALEAIKNAELGQEYDAVEALIPVQDWRPKAVWISLGHQMGFLKHPCSEDFKCSNCGYVLYSLFELHHPKTCPECGAEMTGTDNE